MRTFQFASVVRKYFRPYTLIRTKAGEYDDDGVWIPGGPIHTTLQGNVQPISARLLQAEAGRYSATDRMLFTLSTHDNGDLVEHQGIQYNVVESVDREYRDVNQYVIRRVVANARVP